MADHTSLVSLVRTRALQRVGGPIHEVEFGLMVKKWREYLSNLEKLLKTLFEKATKTGDYAGTALEAAREICRASDSRAQSEKRIADVKKIIADLRQQSAIQHQISNDLDRRMRDKEAELRKGPFRLEPYMEQDILMKEWRTSSLRAYTTAGQLGREASALETNELHQQTSLLGVIPSAQAIEDVKNEVLRGHDRFLHAVDVKVEELERQKREDDAYWANRSAQLKHAELVKARFPARDRRRAGYVTTGAVYGYPIVYKCAEGCPMTVSISHSRQSVPEDHECQISACVAVREGPGGECAKKNEWGLECSYTQSVFNAAEVHTCVARRLEYK